MSTLWKLAQSSYMLGQSRMHKDVFPDGQGPLARQPYEFFVDATMHALFGVKDYLHAEFSRCKSESGVVFEDWYNARVLASIKDDTNVLSFLFRKGEGVRQMTTHKEPPLLSSSGSRSRGQTFSVIGGGPQDDVVRDPEGSFTSHVRMDWYFQEIQFSDCDDSLPAWKKAIAGRTVDDVLQEAFEILASAVREATSLFESDPARASEANQYIDYLLANTPRV